MHPHYPGFEISPSPLFQPPRPTPPLFTSPHLTSLLSPHVSSVDPPFVFLLLSVPLIGSQSALLSGQTDYFVI